MTTTLTAHLDNTVQLVHAIPGRIRLRTKKNEFESIAERLKQQFASLQSHLDVQKHPTTNSIILRFDPNLLPLPSVLNQLPVQQVGSAIDRPQPDSEPAISDKLFSTDETDTPEQLWNITQLAVPMLAGYAAVRVLGVSGWLSIPVFLLSDVIARELLKQIEQITPSPPMSEHQGSWWNLIDLSALFKPPHAEEHPFNGQPDSPLGQDINTEASQIDYTIKHAIPGRIRINIPRLQRDLEYAQTLTELVKSDRNITDVRLNRMSGSIVIYYIPDQIEQATMRSHLIDLIQATLSGSLPATGAEPAQLEDTVAEPAILAEAEQEVAPLILPPSTIQDRPPLGEAVVEEPEPIVSTEEEETAPSIPESATTQEPTALEEGTVEEQVSTAEAEEAEEEENETIAPLYPPLPAIAPPTAEMPEKAPFAPIKTASEDTASEFEAIDTASEQASLPEPEATPESSAASAEPAVPAILSTRALSERLHVSPNTIRRHKTKADFSEWSRSHDPDGIAWLYLRKSGQFTAETTGLSIPNKG